MNKERQNINKELSVLLREFIDNTETELTSVYHIGKVVDNKDPEKLGRVRIRVFGVHSKEIPDDDLPWALSEQNFSGSLLGSMIIPPIDAILNVRFANGNIYEPIFTSKLIKKGKIPKDAKKDYPNTLVFFELDNGDKFTINKETSETIYTQNGGNTITMSSAGDFTIEQTNGNKFTMSSDGEIKLENNLSNVTLDKLGNVIIDQALAIKLGGNSAVIPCPDLPTCLVTGAPLAVNTLIPGNQVLVP